MAFINSIVPLSGIPPVKPPAMSANGIIPVAEYRECIAKIQSDFPFATLKDVLGSLRCFYYSGIKFLTLIPQSGIISYPPPQGTYEYKEAMPVDLLPLWGDKSRLARLKEMAGENALDDNPSPYIEIVNRKEKELVDIGHLLLTFDALLNPNAAPPYTTYGIPSISIASWVADIAIAAYWQDYYEKNQLNSLLKNADFIDLEGRDVNALRTKMTSKPSGPTEDDFFGYSAPDSDLLGDIDGFVIKHLSTQYPNASLANLFDRYYLDPTNRFVHKRYWFFCFLNTMNYDYGTKDWVDVDKIYSSYVPRIDRCIDLFYSGQLGAFGNAIKSIVSSSPPPSKSYPASKRFLQKFLNWLKIRLQKELEQTQGKAMPTEGRMFPD